MERKRELFSPSKDKAGFWKITGTITFAFIYLLTEIILWFALKDNVFNQVFLGQMLFICCNVILLLGLGLYLWLPPKQGKNIESLLPAIRPYHHICDSLQDEILLDHICLLYTSARFYPDLQRGAAERDVSLYLPQDFKPRGKRLGESSGPRTRV